MQQAAFEELLKRFSAAAEAGDGEAFAQCFTPDGVYHDYIYGDHSGRASIAHMLTDLFRRDAGAFAAYLVDAETNPVTQRRRLERRPDQDREEDVARVVERKGNNGVVARHTHVEVTQLGDGQHDCDDARGQCDDLPACLSKTALFDE